MTAAEIETNVVERFLRYVRIDTQSKEGSSTYPSTAGQLELLRLLVDELQQIGVTDAQMDEHGYVFGTIPPTTRKGDVPTIGFISHVDTSPEMPGKDVKPILHENYAGGDLRLPDDPDAVISAADNPHLARQVGNDIITASGTTLLGADNKAGVAEIMAAAEYLLAHPEIPHGPVRLGFTPDEEIGQGTRYFDVERFGAFCAYTIDGEHRGELQIETFSADAMTVTFQGFNTHPGFAKGKMVNALKAAGDFLSRLPADRAPENTDGYDGFVHPYTMGPSVESTAVRFIVRDFDTAKLAEMEAMLERLAAETAADHPGIGVRCEVEEQYRNMKEVLDRHPEVVAVAEEAYRRAGLDPRIVPVRGGTDGSRLSFMGLPTPNVFAGEHNFHSRFEWISTADMHKAVEVIVEICRVWEERGKGQR